MTFEVRVTMPLTEMRLSTSVGFRSRMTLVSSRLYGLHCTPLRHQLLGMAPTQGLQQGPPECPVMLLAGCLKTTCAMACDTCYAHGLDLGCMHL